MPLSNRFRTRVQFPPPPPIMKSQLPRVGSCDFFVRNRFPIARLPLNESLLRTDTGACPYDGGLSRSGSDYSPSYPDPRFSRVFKNEDNEKSNGYYITFNVPLCAFCAFCGKGKFALSKRFQHSQRDNDDRDERRDMADRAKVGRAFGVFAALKIFALARHRAVQPGEHEHQQQFGV